MRFKFQEDNLLQILKQKNWIFRMALQHSRYDDLLTLSHSFAQHPLTNRLVVWIKRKEIFFHDVMEKLF